MMTFDLTVTLRQMTNYTPADILKTARFAMKRAIEDNVGIAFILQWIFIKFF